MHQKNRVYICGIWIDNLSMSESVSRIGEFVRARKPSYVVTPNVDHLVKLQKDELFRRIYDDATLVLADGMPLIWHSYFLGTPLKAKVSGSDLVPELCENAAKEGYKLFFLGGRPGAAEKAKAVLEKKYPGIQIVGAYCPAFGFEKYVKENLKIVEMIKQAAPDILLVGLGAPKQEKWIYNYYQLLGVPVSIGVGVTFELIARIVSRAPKWMQGVGLEWFWRLSMEPRRLWRRYLLDCPRFLILVLKQKFTNNN